MPAAFLVVIVISLRLKWVRIGKWKTVSSKQSMLGTIPYSLFPIPHSLFPIPYSLTHPVDPVILSKNGGGAERQ